VAPPPCLLTSTEPPPTQPHTPEAGTQGPARVLHVVSREARVDLNRAAAAIAQATGRPQPRPVPLAEFLHAVAFKQTPVTPLVHVGVRLVLSDRLCVCCLNGADVASATAQELLEHLQVPKSQLVASTVVAVMASLALRSPTAARRLAGQAPVVRVLGTMPLLLRPRAIG
jgi:hypothetical protein